MMRQVSELLERRQVPLYLAALGIGAIVGLALPAIAPAAEVLINPVLGLLLYATFLGVPFAKIGEAVRDWRFLATIAAVNFALVPVVVFALSRVVAHDRVLLVGVLIVLLTPCVDYVIVFTGLAGGAKDRLLAAAPVLMLAQMLLLPLYLWLLVGGEFVRAVDLGPFVEAFLMLIAVPLAVAGLTQLAAARTRWGRAIERAFQHAMVPLMMITRAVVVASLVHGVSQHLGSLALTIPIYALFPAAMLPIGACAAHLARLDVPSSRAVAFSGSTRNSLVVLPLVLALPGEFALAPLVVVTQTLVELVVMVVFVRLVPHIIRT